MVGDGEPHGARVEEPTHPVAPEQPGDDGREGIAEGEHEREVPPVLPADERVARQVGGVDGAGPEFRFDDDPANVGPQEAAGGVVGVAVGVGVSVVRAVGAGPPEAGALHGADACEEEEELEDRRGDVGSVGPEPVVSCRSGGGGRGGRRKRSREKKVY
jgi:hypothetical protein